MRNAIGVFLGGAVLFVWGALSWMFLPMHNSTMKYLPEERLITDTLRVVVKEPGFYFFPSNRGAAGPVDDKEWQERYQKGPVGIMIYSPTGSAPMGPITFIVSFVADLAVAGLSLLLLTSSRLHVKNFVPRVLFVVCLGLVCWLAVDLPYWNWFHYPTDVTMVALFDMVVGFGLLGAVLAKFVPQA